MIMLAGEIYMNDDSKVEAVMDGTGIIAKSDYLRWARSRDLSTRARAYALSATAWDRIKPEPSMEEQCGAMAEYLFECLKDDPPEDDFIYSRFKAGHELSEWLKHLSSMPEAKSFITDIVRRLETLYKQSDPKIRNRIETGVLEHILESPRLRPLFVHWQKDPVLREAYEPALEWGLAHSESAG
jgi:hypothetical protein